MKQLVIFLVVVFLFIGNQFSSAQNTGSALASIQLNPIALMDIEPNNSSVVLNVSPVTEAGTMNSTSMSNNIKWINFSSSLAPSTPNRTILVGVASGNLPAGVRVKIQTSPYSGTGNGSIGNQTNEITISSTYQTLINNIGAGFTGNGINNGYMIRYVLEISDFRLLDFNNSQTVSVSYILSEI
ncbi:MAG: hypothetical protein KGZ87_02610 [Bacteroidetes bacterium]|nr:hypothetical protein [Bacteroidota bacterium]